MSVMGPHGVPPYCASVIIVRVRVLVPPPQTPHGDHGPQSLTTQFIGHGCVLHVVVSDREGHAVPLYSGGIVTVRERLVYPPPQLAVHCDHAVQPLTSQFTDSPLLIPLMTDEGNIVSRPGVRTIRAMTNDGKIVNKFVIDSVGVEVKATDEP